jgi:hypothetical protein
MTKGFAIHCLLLLVALACLSCSNPQMEDPKCTASRQTVQSFYSEYFADSGKNGFNRDTIEKKEKFLAPDLYKLLQTDLDRQASGGLSFLNWDPFIDSSEEATGFKVGECKVFDDIHITHTVRLFWKTDNKPTIGEIKVKTVRISDQWLITDFTGEKNGSVTQRLSAKMYIN